LRNLLPVTEEALARAAVSLADIGCVAVHSTPGLVGALLVGVSAAKMFALALGVPLVAVNHIHSHLFACRLAAGQDIFPCIGLVVSGGHTALFRCESALSIDLLGSTRDDAAGEAFDKVAAILGLGFPGGPAVEREAASGDPMAYAFPRSFLGDARLEFSFSGLKTAVLYACHGQNVANAEPPPPGQKRADLAASFQAAVVDVLVVKCRQALRQSGLKRLAVGGGVSANQRLRDQLEKMCAKDRAELSIPPLSLCTDNAAMAALAVEKWKRGEIAPADLDAEPNFV
jgi:N6-L-threonylcarbamoyladenine synthase